MIHRGVHAVEGGAQTDRHEQHHDRGVAAEPGLRPCGHQALAVCIPEGDGESPFDRFAYRAGDLGAAGGGQFILVDNRSVDDLAASIAEHIRLIRVGHVLSQGEPTARMVSIILLHNIFRSAAGTTTERFAASDVLAILKMPDNTVAHALGSFDWGVPIGGIPTFSSTVPRVRQWTRSPPRYIATQTVVNSKQPS